MATVAQIQQKITQKKAKIERLKREIYAEKQALAAVIDEIKAITAVPVVRKKVAR